MNKYLEIFQNKGKEADEAFAEILALQNGETEPIFTGQSWLDVNLVGGLNNKVVFALSRPSMGKTHNSASIQNYLLDNYEDIRILRMNLEMPTQSLLLRELKNSSGKKMKDIVSKPFTEEELNKAKETLSKFKDSRVTDFSKPVVGEEYRQLLRAFYLHTAEEEKTLKRKLKKIVIVDHIHVLPSKTEIDEFIEICNEVKMVDKNISFLIYGQLNRTIEDTWREAKEKKGFQVNMLPSSKYIYMSDKLQQYADIVVAFTIPQVVDLEEFASVNKARNQHLKEHFIDDGKDSEYAKLKGLNRIYYNFIKIRMNDDFDEPRLFCELLDPERESVIEAVYKDTAPKSSPIEVPTFDFSMPTLETPPPITPITPLDAFGEPDDDSPF